MVFGSAGRGDVGRAVLCVEGLYPCLLVLAAFPHSLSVLHIPGTSRASAAALCAYTIAIGAFVSCPFFWEQSVCVVEVPFTASRVTASQHGTLPQTCLGIHFGLLLAT